MSVRMDRLRAGLVLAPAVPFATPAQEGVGVLSEVLPQQEVDGARDKRQVAQGVAMTTGDDPGARTCYDVEPRPEAHGRRRVEVQVSVHPESRGSGGLLHGLVIAAGTYFVLPLEPGDAVSFYRRDSEGVSRMMSTSTDDVREGKNPVAVQESGGEVAMFVNGREPGAIATTGTGGGAVGIAAAGLVQAVFDGVTVTP